MEIIFLNSDEYMGQIADISSPRNDRLHFDTFLDTSAIRQNPFYIEYHLCGDTLKDFRQIFSIANGQSMELNNLMRKSYKRHFINLRLIMEDNNIGIGNTVNKELKNYIRHRNNGTPNICCEGSTYPSKLAYLKTSLVDNLINDLSYIRMDPFLISMNRDKYQEIESICNKAYINAIINNRDKKSGDVFNAVGNDDIIIAESILYSSIKETPVNIISADKDFELIANELDMLKDEFTINFNVTFYHMKSGRDGIDIVYKKKIER